MKLICLESWVFNSKPDTLYLLPNDEGIYGHLFLQCPVGVNKE